MLEIFVILFGVLLGGVPTIYLIWSAVTTIAQKFYRKMKYGTSLFD